MSRALSSGTTVHIVLVSSVTMQVQRFLFSGVQESEDGVRDLQVSARTAVLVVARPRSQVHHRGAHFCTNETCMDLTALLQQRGPSHESGGVAWTGCAQRVGDRGFVGADRTPRALSVFRLRSRHADSLL